MICDFLKYGKIGLFYDSTLTKSYIQFIYLAVASFAGACPDDWTSALLDGKEKCFKYAGYHQVQEAAQICHEMGAVVPLPRNQQENDDLLAVWELPNLGIPGMGSFEPRQRYHLALGIDNIANEGQWLDLTGKEVTYFLKRASTVE